MKHFQIAFLGLMLTLVVVSTNLEAVFLTPFFPPFVKPGLANIIVMFTALTIGRKQALALNIMKSVFVLAIRGPIAGLMSLSGGTFSVLVIVLLVTFLSEKHISYITLGVCGALFHNFGQLLAAIWLIDFSGIFYYIPILIIAGTVTGVITGTLLKLITPTLNRAYKFR